MKDYKCPECYREREAGDDCTMYICHCCQVEMEEVKDGDQ